ncbi:thiol:disulfide interchange protein [Halalkalibacter wakoensis JCM 9140]|uniref:Thiol:disulfide interchange protein n=1 Tax=Halalkalibacter wakoensis JCM 9140 TaxID=1236970 RepID=W4Q4Q1_9BACI|nr:redoxin domain-containing protein [Halalkalibacter wakoensis]GAE26962.1 thiol:disulfide interchange protein [Halalkalibacter wakoensis JCM 9140]
MEEVWIVGPLIIKQTWLMLIALMIIGLTISNLLLYDENRSQVARELYWNSLFYFFITYQLASLFVYPSITIRDPIAVLAMPSGTDEWIIAWVVVTFYVFWKMRNETKVIVFLPILISYLVLEAIYFAFYPFNLNGYPISFYQMMFNLVLLLFYYIQLQKGTMLQRIAIRIAVLYGSVLGMCSLVLEVRMFHVTVPSWFYFLIGLIGLLSSKKITFVKSSLHKNIKKGKIVLVVLAIILISSLFSPTNQVINMDSTSTSKVAVGQRAPDFLLTTIDGEEQSLSNYKGQSIMLNFWATWCPPCRAEMPEMEKFFLNEDVMILAINATNTESTVDHVQEFVSGIGLSFPILLDEREEISSLYQVGPMPTSFFINEEGIITNIHIGAMNEDMMVRTLQQIE